MVPFGILEGRGLLVLEALIVKEKDLVVWTVEGVESPVEVIFSFGVGFARRDRTERVHLFLFYYGPFKDIRILG